ARNSRGISGKSFATAAPGKAVVPAKEQKGRRQRSVLIFIEFCGRRRGAARETPNRVSTQAEKRQWRKATDTPFVIWLGLRYGPETRNLNTDTPSARK